MKNRFKYVAIGLLVVSAALFSGCSKYKFYTMAIDSRRSGAELSVKSVNISIGTIVYLDNVTDKNARADQDVILMVHGFGGNKDNWVLLADRMTDDYRLIALDLPGHGDSVSDTSLSYTMDNQATWMNEFMEALQIPRVHVIGNSMGGAISIALTHRFPEKVLSLTLVDSAGQNKTDSEYIELLKKGINPLVVGNRDEFAKLMDFVMEKKPYIPGPILSVLAEEKIARKTVDEKVFKDMLTDVIQVGDYLQDIQTPTLILWGDHDRVIHVDNAEAFHEKIKGSQTVILAGVGHVPMLEAPKQTNDHYRRFLSTIKPL